MFANRKDAAEQLGRAMEKYRNMNVLVLGIPRGGVETAFYLAKHLNAELSLVIARKLAYPFNPEAAFGAVAEDGNVYISEMARQHLTDQEINEILWKQNAEIQRRIQKFRRGKRLPAIEGRTVIIADDGIATGATLFAAIALCKTKKAGKIVVASPVAGKAMEGLLRKMVDEVVILETPSFYSAVSQGYEDFYNLSDEEALTFIAKWEEDHPAHQA